MQKILQRLTFCFIIFFTNSMFGQIGGLGTFKFLNLPQNARVAALGGSSIFVFDGDVNMTWQNPANLNKEMHKKTALTYINYVSDISYATANYVHHIDSVGTFSAGLQYVDYGDFIGSDITGKILNNFSGNEFCFQVGYGHQISKFGYGANVKIIQSQLETYNSNGFAVDLATSYIDTAKNFTAGLVFKNIGVQVNKYADTREKLPFDIQLGIAYKLKHAPFRFYLVGHNLHRGDISYINTNKEQQKDFTTGQVIEEKISSTDKIGRHIIAGTELLFGKGFKIQLSYNHKIRKELSIENARGMTGFSFGAWMRIRSLTLAYGRSNIHIAGGSNLFTLGIDIGRLTKKNLVQINN